MYKVMWFLKRKPGLTHEQFRDHFEASHAPMALRFAGHLYSGYQRNYVTQVWSGGDPRAENGGFGPHEFGWDLISEWIMPDEESYLEIQRIMESPGIKEQFWEDEDRFIDRTAIVMIPCEVRDTGVGKRD
jgi:hypothetical protein